MGTDRVHFFKRERENAIAGNFHQRRVVIEQLDGIDFDLGMVVEDRGGHVGFRRQPFFPGKDGNGLDQRIGEQVFAEALDLSARKISRKEILDGGVDLLFPLQLAPDHVLERTARGAANIVGHAGLKADFEQPVERFRRRKPLHGGFSHNRIGEGFLHNSRRRVVDVGDHFVDVARTARRNRHLQGTFCPMDYAASAGIRHTVFQTDFNSVDHDPSPALTVKKDGRENNRKKPQRAQRNREKECGLFLNALSPILSVC